MNERDAGALPLFRHLTNGLAPLVGGEQLVPRMWSAVYGSSARCRARLMASVGAAGKPRAGARLAAGLILPLEM
jgi:hypothetical protein